MLKKCEFCGKEFFVADRPKAMKKRFCNTSCSAKWRVAKFGMPEVSEQGRKNQSESMKRSWQTESFRTNNHKRMTENNPVYMPGVVEKANITRLKNKSYHNNYRYGNGKISEYEQKYFDRLTQLGFLYNFAIPTKIAKRAFPEKRYPDNYKPDFVNLIEMICIEIDGPNHLHTQELDKKKDECLNYLGFTVLRFTHEEIDNGILERWIDAWEGL